MFLFFHKKLIIEPRFLTSTFIILSLFWIVARIEIDKIPFKENIAAKF